MSQAGIFSTSIVPPGGAVETLTGNSGGAVGPDGANNIDVVGDGTTINVVGNPGTNTLTISALGGVSQSFDTDSGTAVPAAGVLNIITDNAALNAGSTVLFSGSGNTVLLDVTDEDNNTIIGLSSGNLTQTGSFNTVLGTSCGSNFTSATSNVMIGTAAGGGITSGSFNTYLGALAGFSHIGNERSNICIGYVTDGMAGESNTLCIGDSTGSGDGSLNRCFISGIQGINVGSVATVVTCNANQQGTAVITGGSGITVTPGANTITISTTENASAITSVNNAASPYDALSTDYYLACQTSTGVITIRLPNAPTTGKTYIIKDSNGAAAASNITVTTPGGVVNIDGATSFVMNTAYESINVIFTGSAYEIY